MITFSSVAPVLPVSNLPDAARRYELLGFTVRLYEGGEYAFASRGDVDLHLATVQRVRPAESTVAVYLYVSDAHALHSEWTNAGVDGRHVPPVHTDYGLIEGAYVDPDGNLLRFGSPIVDSTNSD
ncbi:MAG: VOC family protein [Mycobacteriales bacterium]